MAPYYYMTSTGITAGFRYRHITSFFCCFPMFMRTGLIMCLSFLALSAQENTSTEANGREEKSSTSKDSAQITLEEDSNSKPENESSASDSDGQSTAQDTNQNSAEANPSSGRPAVLPDELYGQDLNEDASAQGALEEDKARDDGPGLWGMFTQVMVFLIILAGATMGFIHYVKRGKINIGALKTYAADQHLVISESRMLGNRQYLMVVEYGAQKMLLAVTPGRVDHLCFLETPFEEDLAEFEEEDGEQANE